MTRVVEHAVLYSDGSMLVRPSDLDSERIYPLAEWIAFRQRHGGKVFARTVEVIEDWTEVPHACEDEWHRGSSDVDPEKCPTCGHALKA